MERFNIKDFSVERISKALDRRFGDLFHEFRWRFSPMAHENKEKLKVWQGIHAGERCFIIGNGPSLAKMDLSPLKDEITFGLNRIYLLFDKIPFTPTYYVSVNELVLEQFASDIAALSMPKFVNWNSRRYFNDGDSTINFLRLKLSLRDGFNSALNSPFYSGGTVTYVAIQLAYIMGFSEVILIGVDHSFVDKGTPNQTEIREQTIDKNHFHPDYFPKGVKWQLPDLLRSEIAYSIARKKFEEDGRKIVDATVDGKLDVFEKVIFEDLF